MPLQISNKREAGPLCRVGAATQWDQTCACASARSGNGGGGGGVGGQRWWCADVVPHRFVAGDNRVVLADLARPVYLPYIVHRNPFWTQQCDVAMPTSHFHRPKRSPTPCTTQPVQSAHCLQYNASTSRPSRSMCPRIVPHGSEPEAVSSSLFQLASTPDYGVDSGSAHLMKARAEAVLWQPAAQAAAGPAGRTAAAVASRHGARAPRTGSGCPAPGSARPLLPAEGAYACERTGALVRAVCPAPGTTVQVPLQQGREQRSAAVRSLRYDDSVSAVC